MRRNAHISGGTRQGLVFPVRDVFLCVRVYVLLRQAEVDDVDDVLVLHPQSTDQEVLRFYVTVYQLSTVDNFDSLQLKSSVYNGKRWDQLTCAKLVFR